MFIIQWGVRLQAGAILAQLQVGVVIFKVSTHTLLYRVAVVIQWAIFAQLQAGVVILKVSTHTLCRVGVVLYLPVQGVVVTLTLYWVGVVV